jgi:hypothetical protein
MGDVDVKRIERIEKLKPLQIEQLTGVEPLRISQVTGIEPLRVSHIAPAAVHIKELNHIDPISVESLRVDEVRNVEALRVERLDVTRLPTVNLSVRDVPAVDLNVQRVPPVAIGIHQQFCLPSNYTVHAKLLGVEFLRLQIHGQTMLAPQDPVPREQSRSHERSFADVAAVGNPAIPVQCEEKTAVAFAAHGPPQGCGHPHPQPQSCRHPHPQPQSCRHSHPQPQSSRHPHPRAAAAPPRPELSAGAPRFSFSLSPQPAPLAAATRDGGTVGSGNL